MLDWRFQAVLSWKALSDKYVNMRSYELWLAAKKLHDVFGVLPGIAYRGRDLSVTWSASSSAQFGTTFLFPLIQNMQLESLA